MTIFLAKWLKNLFYNSDFFLFQKSSSCNLLVATVIYSRSINHHKRVGPKMLFCILVTLLKVKITAAVSRDNCSRFRVKLTCDKIGRSNVGSTKDEAGPLDILAWKISIDILSLCDYGFSFNWTFCEQITTSNSKIKGQGKNWVLLQHRQAGEAAECSVKITGKLSKK